MTKKINVTPLKDEDRITTEIQKDINVQKEILIPETINEKTASYVIDQIYSSCNIYYELVQRDNPNFSKNPILHLNEIMHILKDYDIIITTPLS